MAIRRTSPLRRRRQVQNLFGFGLIALAILVVGMLKGGNPAPEVRAEYVSAHPIVGQFDTVEVPVPISPVTAGTFLKDVRFRNVAFPVHQVPKDALLDLKPYLASMAIAPLPANLPIFQKNLTASASASNPVIERIPEGMRAMTVRVDATGAVEGWASSGAIVDVLLVTADGTSVVAEKVRVLSAARSVNPIQNVTATSVPSTVTLLVTQEQCLAINTAIPLGKIAFALRSLGDEGNWNQRKFSKESLKGGPADLEAHRIQGYVRIEGENPKTFALSGNSWIPTEVQPERILGDSF
ncbi:MAG: Flp pilus assembly protein CpaB [Bdellovibrionales bacterium]|nr:Flp pilus assembly protein CpaB [Bdellovibrionales bacterium]